MDDDIAKAVDVQRLLFEEAERVLRPAISRTAWRVSSQLSDLLEPDIKRAFETLPEYNDDNVHAVVEEAIRRVAEIWSNREIRIVVGDSWIPVKGFGG